MCYIQHEMPLAELLFFGGQHGINRCIDHP